MYEKVRLTVDDGRELGGRDEWRPVLLLVQCLPYASYRREIGFRDYVLQYLITIS